MAEFSKTPDETFTIAIDFTGKLDSGETVTGKTVSATCEGADATATVIDASSIVSPQVKVKVKAGSNGSHYKIKVLATTSTTQTYEHNVTMKVEAQ